MCTRGLGECGGTTPLHLQHIYWSYWVSLDVPLLAKSVSRNADAAAGPGQCSPGTATDTPEEQKGEGRTGAEKSVPELLARKTVIGRELRAERRAASLGSGEASAARRPRRVPKNSGAAPLPLSQANVWVLSDVLERY